MSLPESPTVRRALLQERAGSSVVCLTCERRCVVAEGERGWCGTRVNHQGTLYTLTYGAVSSISANPIEKKPLYHFHPGSLALTVGSWGCNFACPWCQNWSTSRTEVPGSCDFKAPEAFVAQAVRQGCQGTSISFNEPTLSLEWSLDVLRLARIHGLYNTFVTNGYLTAAAIELLAEAGLDALNIDIKGDSAVLINHADGIDVEHVWKRCGQSLELGLHLEITTLVIPGINDSQACLTGIAKRIASDLGRDTPWHVSGYTPAHDSAAPPTPITTLERAWDVGHRAGLRHVYIGNVPGHPRSNTRCPQCDQKLVKRAGFSVVHLAVRDGRCPSCGTPIAGTGWSWREA